MNNVLSLKSFRYPDTLVTHRCECVLEARSAAVAAGVTLLVVPSEGADSGISRGPLSRDRLSGTQNDVLTGQDDGEQGTPRGTDHRPGVLSLREIFAAALSRRAGPDAAAAEAMYAELYGE